MSMDMVIHGDNLDVMRAMADNSVDAIVTDPPAGISFMGKGWDKDHGGRDAWVAWLTEVMAEALRVAKPGAHALVWALPRTSGWTHRALEDAGWEVRDCITHLTGQGFPKSRDISKALDKAAGAEREVIGPSAVHSRGGATSYPKRPGEKSVEESGRVTAQTAERAVVTAPATDLARQWDGWGTATKPAAEFWYLARKPISEKNIAANVERWGVGGIHVDACRITLNGEARPTGSGDRRGSAVYAQDTYTQQQMANGGNQTSELGRWPANVLLDEESAALLDAQTGNRRSAGIHPTTYSNSSGYGGAIGRVQGPLYADTGGASRFFYCAKASTREKSLGLDGTNTHPTPKPLSLMRYLCKLVTPPDGLILDPFAGSGSTGCAAVLEGFRFIGCDAEEEYVEIANRRIAYWAGQRDAA